jgi:hypothetical protein
MISPVLLHSTFLGDIAFAACIRLIFGALQDSRHGAATQHYSRCF